MNEDPSIAGSDQQDTVTAAHEGALPDTGKEAAQQAAAVSHSPSTGTSMTESSKPSSENQAAQPAPVVIKQSGGKGLAAGALVLALLGLGASGFLFVQGQNVLKNQELNVEHKLDKAALGESNNANVLQETLRKQTEVEGALAQLGGASRQNAEQIANAQRAYQELLKSRVSWLVDETESTLNTASQQLLLSGNVPVAISVLESLEARLGRFEQPELLPIKQAISNDLAALKNRPYLDVSSASLRLNRLETAVASMPLLVDGTLQPGKAAPAAAPADPNAPWWQHAWDTTLESLKGMVEVRKLNSSDAMLIAPDQSYFVKENLRLRLLDARNALMQRNGEIYQADLNDAEAAVKQYFDAKSPATQSWLKELAELKGLDVRTVSDDALKASVAAVRSYQDGARASISVGARDAGQAASAPVASASESAKPSAASAAAAPASATEAKSPPAAKEPAKKEALIVPAQPEAEQPAKKDQPKQAEPASAKGGKA